MLLVLSPIALEVVPGHAVHAHRGVEVSHQERAVRQQSDLALDAVKPAREIVTFEDKCIGPSAVSQVFDGGMNKTFCPKDTEYLNIRTCNTRVPRVAGNTPNAVLSRWQDCASWLKTCFVCIQTASRGCDTRCKHTAVSRLYILCAPSLSGTDEEQASGLSPCCSQDLVDVGVTQMGAMSEWDKTFMSAPVFGTPCPPPVRRVHLHAIPRLSQP